jgi:hypothetical protein
MSGPVEARVIRRHCAERGCRKCIAQGHWLKRKAWRTRKSPARTPKGRKTR